MEEQIHHSELKQMSSLARWPKVLGLEQFFQDMEIAEESAFLDIQETRDGTEDTLGDRKSVV